MTAATPFPTRGRSGAPFSGPMRLLDRVVSHDLPVRRSAAIDPAASRKLAGDASASDANERPIPIWVGIEYMAQCIAVHGGLVARQRGESSPVRASCWAPDAVRFDTPATSKRDRELRVAARHHRGEERKLVVFDCEVGDRRRRLEPLASWTPEHLSRRQLAGPDGAEGGMKRDDRTRRSGCW